AQVRNMSRRSLVEELDRAIQTMLRHPDAKICGAGPEIAPLVELVAELRRLPAEAFRARLGVELQPRALAGLDLRAALAELPDMAQRHLARMNESTIGISRISGNPRWERHPDGDELLHVLEGEIEVTTLTESGAVLTTVPAGSFFVCPRGLWRR